MSDSLPDMPKDVVLRHAPKLPSKLSMDVERDRSWLGAQHEKGLKIRAVVNGIEQNRIVAFDTEKGWLEKQVVDETTGEPVLDARNRRVETTIVQGRVSVEWRYDE